MTDTIGSSKALSNLAKRGRDNIDLEEYGLNQEIDLSMQSIKKHKTSHNADKDITNNISDKVLTTDNGTDNLVIQNQKSTFIALNEKSCHIIEGYVRYLKSNLELDIFEHIIASLLEINTEKKSYLEVLNTIFEEVENIKYSENKEIYCSVYLLGKSIAGYNREIRELHSNEIADDVDAWELQSAGEVCNIIYDNLS